MSEQQTCREVMRQAKSSRPKHVYNALKDIKQKYIKTQSGINIFVSAGLVQRLLELVKVNEGLDVEYQSKIIDIAMSILGNLCMDEGARLQVLLYIFPQLFFEAKLLMETDSQTLQNRSCRCLANTLLNPRSWKLAHQSPVLEKIVKLLQDTDNEEYKQTYIRTIRLLGQTGSHVDQLLDLNTLHVVLQHFDDSVENKVSQLALRCVHSLSMHRCTSQFAGQVISSGKISALLSLTLKENTESIQLLVHLCDNHNFRAEFGNAGGIAAFRKLFQESNTLPDIRKTDLINVLCLCCKEAVNRVKLREEKVLILFLDILSSRMYENLHARIVSAIVCFLYDDASFEFLAENGLVDVLVKQLRKCFRDCNTEINDISEVPIEHGNEFSNHLTVEATDSENSARNIHVEDEGGLHIKDGTNDVIGMQKEEPCDEFDGKQAGKSRPLYSINSPTYLANFDWKEEETGGVKCKKSFTPPHQFDWSKTKVYSPFSNESYYSPKESSSEYSPNSLPSMSPTRGKRNVPANIDASDRKLNSNLINLQSSPPSCPKYTGISLYYTYERNPASVPTTNNSKPIHRNSSICSEKSKLEIQSVSVSDCESASVSTENKDSEKANEDMLEYIPVSSPGENRIEIEVSKDTSQLQKVINTSDQTEKFACCSINHDQENETLTKTFDDASCRKRKRVDNVSVIQEKNILILLSRVSQMTNQTVHLVKGEVIYCLMDYISTMEFPLGRCARLLSRVFRNPDCFQKLLRLNAPLNIFEKLLADEDIVHLLKLLWKTTNTGSHCTLDTDRFSPMESSELASLSFVSDSENATKRMRQEEGEKKLYTLTGGDHKQIESICSKGRCGLAFMEDMSIIADSQYSRGIVDRLLYLATDDTKLRICLNMLFITWSRTSRQFYFEERKVLTKVFDVLLHPVTANSELYHMALIGIAYLAKVLHCQKKYHLFQNNGGQLQQEGHTSGGRNKNNMCNQSNENAIASDNSSDAISPMEEDKVQLLDGCYIEMNDTVMDIMFIVKGCHLKANKQILITKSEIFAAMLGGYYSEAGLTEIHIHETCAFAFEFLLHYLHGCIQEACRVIKQLYVAEVTQLSAHHCIEVLSEADKYLITSLHEQVSQCLITRYIIPDSAFIVFQYACLHDNKDIQKAAVSCALVETKNSKEIVKYFDEFLQSAFVDSFVATVTSILTS